VDEKKMQYFIGAVNFYHEFLHEFARIAVPLDECHSDKKLLEHLSTFKLSRNLRIVLEKH
jgi:hypothetical protein